LIVRLEKTILSEKMIKEDLSWVEESATKFTYRLSVGFERCEDKTEKSAPKFIPSSTYYNKEAIIKPTKSHYSSNRKPSFNPKREARKEISSSREEGFVCMFCGHADHLDEFCFRRKRIERRRVERVTYSSRSAHLFCFSNTLFGTLFEPRNIRHALSDSSWVNATYELENFGRNQVRTLVKPLEM
jgi:hypothetical protein